MQVRRGRNNNLIADGNTSLQLGIINVADANVVAALLNRGIILQPLDGTPRWMVRKNAPVVFAYVAGYLDFAGAAIRDLNRSGAGFNLQVHCSRKFQLPMEFAFCSKCGGSDHKYSHAHGQLCRYSKNSGHKCSLVQEVCSTKKARGWVPCLCPGRLPGTNNSYCRMTWSPWFSPFRTSVLAPFEIPMLMATFFLPSLPFGSGTSTEALRSLSYTMEPSGICNTFLCSSRMISALAVISAFNSPPGLSIETRTSNVVTLSFSTPIGEIFVTLPLKVLSLNDSTLIREGWPRYTRPISASSTFPFTYTWLVSPMVMTSVALEPNTRIELTASPTSTSRESTMPSIGDSISV